RPERGEEVAVARQSEGLDDAPDELPVAVVLDRVIDAATVDRARDATVGQLIRRVPAEERARLVAIAELRERGAGERAVPDPRAPIGARAALDARPLAIDEDPADRRAQRGRVRDRAR